MTSENPFFARMIVNRIWSHYFGRGLVEPIDTFGQRIPRPMNRCWRLLLIIWCAAVRPQGVHSFDSEFQRVSIGFCANQSNQTDSQNFSHAWKPMPAEVLLDAICQATGVPEQFNGWPARYRAVQIWDNRMPSYFFRVFGRPQRVSVCNANAAMNHRLPRHCLDEFSGCRKSVTVMDWPHV